MCLLKCLCIRYIVDIWKETNENSPIHMKVTSWLFTYLSNRQLNVLSGSDGNLLFNPILELVIEVVIIM